jgi:hypothetical protein
MVKDLNPQSEDEGFNSSHLQSRVWLIYLTYSKVVINVSALG